MFTKSYNMKHLSHPSDLKAVLQSITEYRSFWRSMLIFQ